MADRRLDKAAIRDRVWTALEAAGVAPHGAHGRIPAFVGSERAADRLTGLARWQQARTVKANPDRAQQPVRALALSAGKLLFMAVPKLADPRPFLRLDPGLHGDRPERLADRTLAAAEARPVGVDEMPAIDLVVCGSVAVNHEGVRIGKGAGYADIEVALLAEAGLLKPTTTMVTTVHELQVLDEPLPHRPHDFTVDHILTPERVITCTTGHRPAGIDWAELGPAQLQAIPVLRALAARGRE